MRLSLLKAYKGVFTLKGVIMLENKKNAIEGKREANNQVFLIVRIISANFSLYIVNDFGFLVVIKPSYSPFWNFVFGLPFAGYRFFIKTTNISKFFNSEITFFKFIFELLIIHFYPLKVTIIELYQNKSNLCYSSLLTLKLLLVYNSYKKVTFSYFNKGATQ